MAVKKFGDCPVLSGVDDAEISYSQQYSQEKK